MLDPYLQFFPIDTVQKKFAFFEHIFNSHLIDIPYHCDSCYHEVDLRGIEILRRENICVLRFEDILLFFQIIVTDSRLWFWIRDYRVSLYLSLSCHVCHFFFHPCHFFMGLRMDPIQTIVNGIFNKIFNIYYQKLLHPSNMCRI